MQDIDSLEGIGREPSSLDRQRKAREVARAFETFLLEQLLKQARATSRQFGEGASGGQGTHVREMADQLTARQIAASGVLGIQQSLRLEER